MYFALSLLTICNLAGTSLQRLANQEIASLKSEKAYDSLKNWVIQDHSCHNKLCEPSEHASQA